MNIHIYSYALCMMKESCLSRRLTTSMHCLLKGGKIFMMMTIVKMDTVLGLSVTILQIVYLPRGTTNADWNCDMLDRFHHTRRKQQAVFKVYFCFLTTTLLLTQQATTLPNFEGRFLSILLTFWIFFQVISICFCRN